MKNSTFTKTALSTLIALSLAACSHNSPSNDYPATQKLIEKKDNALDAAVTAKEAAVKAKENAEKAKAKAESDLTKANSNITTLKKEIAELKQKGKDTTDLEAKLAKANNKAKELVAKVKQADNKVKELEGNMKQAKEKAKRDLAEANSKLKQADDDIVALKKKIAELKQKGKDTSALEAKLAEANNKAKELKNQLKKAEQDAATAKDAKAAAKEQAKAAEQAKKAAEEQAKVAEQAKAAAEDKAKAAEKAKEEAEKDKTTAEKAKADAEEELTTANKKIAKLKDRIDALKKNGDDTKVLEKQLEEAKKAKADAEKAKEEAEKQANAAEKAKKAAEDKAKAAEKAKKDAVNAKNNAITDKETAEKAKKAAEDKAKAAEKAKTEAEKAKEEAEKQAKAAKKAKKEAEEKLKAFERVEDYQDGTVPYKAENVSVDADAGTPREKFQSAIDKFSFKKIFEAKGSVNASDNATMSVPVMEIDGHQVSIDRHDLDYSSIATMSAQIDTFMMPDWNGDLQQQTAGSTVLAVTGQPTDTSKISFKELKAQNKGDLTYEGRALYAVHKKEAHETAGNQLTDKPYNYDIMKSENSWAKPTFKVNLEKAKISGKMDFGTTDQALKITLKETAIKEKGNQLQFSGVVNATQKTSVTEDLPSWAGGGQVTYSTPHVLENGAKDGKYEGAFMGPNAEELAGKFVIKQDYKRDDKKNSKYGDPVEGRYTKFGNINGVFNAKKVTKGAKRKYENKKLIK